jgi:hypothetical protein
MGRALFLPPKIDHDASVEEVRRGNPLAGLPLRRRAAVAHAVRRGHVVRDPADAGLAVAYARWLGERGRRRIGWVERGAYVAAGLLGAGVYGVLVSDARWAVIVLAVGSLGGLFVDAAASERQLERIDAAEALNGDVAVESKL